VDLFLDHQIDAVDICLVPVDGIIPAQDGSYVGDVEIAERSTKEDFSIAGRWTKDRVIGAISSRDLACIVRNGEDALVASIFSPVVTI